MVDELLLKSEFVYIEKDNVIKRLPYMFALDTFKMNICKELDLLGFEKVNSNKEYKSYLNVSNLTYFITESMINIRALFVSEELARKAILDIMDLVKNIVKNNFSINLISTSLKEDNYYASILLNKDSECENIGEYHFNEEEKKYYVNGTIYLDKLDSLLLYHKDGIGIMTSSLSSLVQVSIIPHKPNEKGVNKACREIYDQLVENGYRVKFFDSSDFVNDKIDKSNLLGIPLRLELSPRELGKNMIRLYYRFDNSFIEIPLENLLKDIKKALNKVNKVLLSESTEQNYQCELGNNSNYLVKYVCESKECISSLEEDNFQIIIPFNQNFVEEKCSKCQNNAVKRIVLIKKRKIKN